MVATYTVEYGHRVGNQVQVAHHFTDDPVACEDFIQQLLDQGHQIRAIRHNGVDLPPGEFDRVIRIGASKLASDRICRALGIKAEEEHFRFGFSS